MRNEVLLNGTPAVQQNPLAPFLGTLLLSSLGIPFRLFSSPPA